MQLDADELDMTVRMGNLRHTLLHPETWMRGLSHEEVRIRRKEMIAELTTLETRLADRALAAAECDAASGGASLARLTADERELRALLEERDPARFIPARRPWFARRTASALPASTQSATNHAQ